MAHSQETLDRLRREQIARLLKWRDEEMRKRKAEQEKILADRRAAEAAAQAELEKLQQPCARVWRIGRTVLWEPPSTVDQLQPAGYWISEEYKGGWTQHGDYLLPTAREGWLFGDGPCRVEVVYPGYLSRGKPSPIIHGTTSENAALVNRVRYWCTIAGRPPEYYERWRRVLSAFGVVNGKKGHASAPLVWPLDPPMTVAEAQGYVDQGWGARWEEVLPVLKRLHGDPAVPELTQKMPPREAQILDAVEDFTGRRTKDGRPYVRPLRKQAEMPDISTIERDEAYLQSITEEG